MSERRLTLIDTLALEQIELNLFRGTAPSQGGARIFGGHVVAQALLAAYGTVEQRLCHSVHCYFLRAGDPTIPILYEVDRSRDGRAFTARRVTAIQHGKQIFNLAASFQSHEEGLDHQDPMPVVAGPDDLPQDEDPRRLVLAKGPPDGPAAAARSPVIEMRRPDPGDFANPEPMAPTQHIWLRAASPIGDEIKLHQVVMAYASDMSFLSTSMRPHGVSWMSPGMQHATLDHAIWFHRPSNFNEWHLYAQKSTSASGSRGMNLGQIFTRDGVLVASTAQEGLIRYRPPVEA